MLVPSYLLALCVLAAADAPAGSADLAPGVDAVEIRLDQPLDRPVDLESYLAFGPGDVLTDAAVRRTLSNFHATGLFDEVEVLTREDDAGTTAVVALTSHTRVALVDVRGESGIRRELLLRRVGQRAGEPLVEDRLLRSVYALQDLYEERGYRRASVRLEVVPHAAEKKVDVVFHVDSGPRATVGGVGFEGDLGPFTDADLRAMTNLEPGELYNRQRILEQVDRVRGALVERQRLRATVKAPRERYDPADDRVHLTYPVAVGPEVHVQVFGADLEELRRKGLLPFLDDQVYDDALVTQSRAAIRSYFQRQGHYHVEVTTREEVEGDHVDLYIDVDLGPVLELTEIRFTGNRNVHEKELRQLMATTARQAFGGGRLVDETLEEDLDNLRSFYVLQGYSRVEVGPVQVESLGQEMVLTIPIEEGPRRRVVQLRLDGVGHLDAEKVRQELPLKRGGPYHPLLLDDSVNLLRALYEEEGYADALVTPRLDWNGDGTLVDVELRVQEGRRSVVDRVILRGLQRTRPEVLRRFAGLEPGEAISRRRLLEAERELYRLGIFSRVDVGVAPRSDPSGGRDVLIRLEEGRRWRLAYGVSYHSDDGLGGLLSLSRVNVGGRGDRLQLDLRANSRDRRFRLIYDQPSLGRLNVPITYTLFRQDEERESFTVEDTGTRVSLTKDLPRLRLGLDYDYRLVNLLETTVDLPDVPREDREIQISSLTPNFYVDRRDDPLDPTRGFVTSTQIEYAFPVLSATANFAKLFVQQAHYVPFGRFGVLAASVRFGAIEPLDPDAERDPLVPPELASGLIPVSERFFAGGRTTHRAYERDTLGIPGETLIPVEGQVFEAGGNGLFLVNLDYRFPIAGNFGGTVFFDLGNVWADWRDVDARDLKPGMGLGLRYRSPIGPVRLEIGWKLDPEPGESTSAVFFLSLGNPF